MWNIANINLKGKYIALNSYVTKKEKDCNYDLTENKILKSNIIPNQSQGRKNHGKGINQGI